MKSHEVEIYQLTLLQIEIKSHEVNEVEIKSQESIEYTCLTYYNSTRSRRR